MSEFRLPRLPRSTKLVNPDGTPALQMQRWWQSVVEDIEAEVGALAAAVAAQAAAEAARDAAGLILVGPTTGTIEAETNGDAADGELPAVYTFTLEEDGVAVTSGVTWAVAVTTGTATAAMAGGVVTLSALTTNTASLTISATYGTVVRKMLLRVSKRIAAADINTGTGGTSATDNSFVSFSGTTYAAVTDTLNIDTGTAGTVELSAPLNLRVSSAESTGEYGATLCWQQDIASVWTDVGSEHSTADAGNAPCEVESDGFVVPGYISVSESLSLSASTSYSFRLMAKSNAADGVTRYLTGTASATGS